MYRVAVRRDFIAQHFLIGGDWGPENELHSHHYVIELQLEGETLDRNGYLVDIVDIEKSLDALVNNYKDHALNELPVFEGINPSIENLARILCVTIDHQIRANNVQAITITVWENDIAWASFRHVRK